MMPKDQDHRVPRGRRAAALLGSGALGLFLLTCGGCEQLVDSSLDTHGHIAPSFPAGTEARMLSVPSGDRRLAGVYVRAARPRGPLLLIFHGDGEAVGDWSAAQTLLAHAGLSSLVFDYSGYGTSTGRPSIDRLHEDARAAYRTAAGLARERAAGVFIVAHSLGGNVALDAAPQFEPQPTGYALWGMTPSLREYVATSGELPRPALFLIPDRWNNVRAAARLNVPILVLHGGEDHVTSAAGAATVARVVPGGARSLEVPGADHNAIYRSPSAAVWEPIIAFALRSSDAAHQTGPSTDISVPNL